MVVEGKDHGSTSSTYGQGMVSLAKQPGGENMPYSFQRGVNLGGWLSQYGRANPRHFDTFITEDDVSRIASWGMDHVRLPLDYPLIEDDAHPGQYQESGLQHIDRCVNWCQTRGLGLILDLHRAPGYSFGTLDSNSLFDSQEDQDRYLALWRFLARRYREVDEGLQLELLNEVVEPTSARWNTLAHRAIAAIRSVDSSRTIIFGGNHYSSVDELQNISLVPDDDHVVYTFHFYKPHLFTHQRAGWSAISRAYNREISYPGDFPDLQAFIHHHPEFQVSQTEHQGRLDASLLQELLEPARRFMQKTRKPLYCGEYGVIDQAPLASRINWHKDLVFLLNEMGIGHAVWSYKGMNFPLIEDDGTPVSQELIDIVASF